MPYNLYDNTLHLHHQQYLDQKRQLQEKKIGGLREVVTEATLIQDTVESAATRPRITRQNAAVDPSCYPGVHLRKISVPFIPDARRCRVFSRSISIASGVVPPPVRDEGLAPAHMAAGDTRTLGRATARQQQHQSARRCSSVSPSLWRRGVLLAFRPAAVAVASVVAARQRPPIPSIPCKSLPLTSTGAAATTTLAAPNPASTSAIACGTVGYSVFLSLSHNNSFPRQITCNFFPNNLEPGSFL